MGDNEAAGRSARPIEAMVLDETQEVDEPDDLDGPDDLAEPDGPDGLDERAERDETAGKADEFVANAVDETGEVRR